LDIVCETNTISKIERQRKIEAAFVAELAARGVTVCADTGAWPERHTYARWSCVEMCRNVREAALLAHDYARDVAASYAPGAVLDARHVTVMREGKDEYTFAARVHDARSCVYCCARKCI
jgi:hypothetical protein